MHPSSSTAFSCGRTGRTVLACAPSLSALSLARALPASVLGPVLRCAFLLFALIRAWLAMDVSLMKCHRCTDRDLRGGPVIRDHPEKWCSSCINRQLCEILLSR